MGVYTKPLDLYKAQKKRFDAVQMGAFAAHKEIAREGLKDALELTSGTVSSKTLKAMGHPFARGRSAGSRTAKGFKRGAVPNLPINKQSGRLHGSMNWRQVNRRHLYSQVFDVGTIQGAGKSGWVLMPAGTRKMVGRGFFTETKKRWRARNKAFQDTYRRLNRKS